MPVDEEQSTGPAPLPADRRKPVSRPIAYGALLFVGTLAATVMSWAAALHWFPELAVHFVPHYAVGAFTALALFLWGRNRAAAAAATCLFAVHALQIAPYMPWPNRTSGNTERPAIRVMSANILTANSRHAEFLALVESENPDILAVLEINETWAEALAALDTEYPYANVLPRADNFGIAMWSRIPWEDIMTFTGDGAYPNGLVAKFGLGKSAFYVMAVHAVPPAGAALARRRDGHLQAIGEYCRRSEAPLILAGDLNTTMWSPSFRNLLRVGGLQDMRRGRGVFPTWPAQWGWAGIPLDHCLYKDMTAVSFRTCEILGSDHRAVIAEFIQPGAADEQGAR